MKKFTNHCQLKEQDNSPEGANNETDHCSLTGTKFKQEVILLNELRSAIKSNADYFRKELENIRRRQ